MVALVALRAIILAAALGGLTVWMAFVRRNPRRVGYGIAALIWLLNVAVFEGMRVIFPDAIEAETLNFWAQAILLQGALTLAGMGMFLARLK